MWILQARSSIFLIKRCVFVFTFHNTYLCKRKVFPSISTLVIMYCTEFFLFFQLQAKVSSLKIFWPNFSQFFNGLDSCITFFDSQINFLHKNCSAHICSKLRSQTSPAWLEKTKNVFHKRVSSFEFSFASRAGIFKKSMGARNRGGIGLSYRPARLHRLAEFIPWYQFRGPINI